MYGSSVMCFYGKGLRINNYTYLMLISHSIKFPEFQSDLSGVGIIWPHMQCSNTAKEATQKIAHWATNQLDWSKFRAKNLIHSLFLAKIKIAPSVWLFCNALTQAFEKVDPTLRGSSKKRLDSLLQKLLLKGPVQTPSGFSWTKPNSN